MKALDRFPDGGEDPEEPIDAGALEQEARMRRNSGKTNIPVALHGLLKAAEEEMNDGEVHFAQVGAVDNDRRTHDVEVILQVLKEHAFLFPVKRIRELPDRDRFGSYGHRITT